MSGLIARAAIDTPDISPPPPIGTTIVSRSGASSSISSADRPRAGDDLRIVERRGRRHSRSRAPARAPWRYASSTMLPWSTTVAPWPCGLRHLHRRRRLRHDDDRRNAEPLGVIGDRLRVIAGRCRDHAARALFVGQLQQFVERAALLVGGGELQILELQPDFRADDLRQGPADQHRRADDRALRSARRAARMSSIVGGCIEALEHSARGLALHCAREQCYAAVMISTASRARRPAPRLGRLRRHSGQQRQRHPGRARRASSSTSPGCSIADDGKVRPPDRPHPMMSACKRSIVSTAAGARCSRA